MDLIPYFAPGNEKGKAVLMTLPAVMEDVASVVKEKVPEVSLCPWVGCEGGERRVWATPQTSAHPSPLFSRRVFIFRLAFRLF